MAMITDIDLDREGKQVASLHLRHSSNESAYGAIPIPIAVVARGSGPTVLLTAGSHGDEYEGQVVLARLMRTLEPADVTGRVIILPTLNPPAAHAGRRLSPIDGANLNRCFPGSTQAGPTSAIAHYVESVLLRRCDAWLDLHSGGTSLDTILCVNILESADPAVNRRSMAMARAFGAPLIVLYDDIGGGGTSLAASRRNGVPALNTEMGGSAQLSGAGLTLCWRGVCNVLAAMGITAGPEPAAPPASRFVQILASSYLFAPAAGVVEHRRQLGETVIAGEPVAWLHSLSAPASAPRELLAGTSGMICMNRPLARTEAGDCVALICPDVAEASMSAWQ